MGNGALHPGDLFPFFIASFGIRQTRVRLGGGHELTCMAGGNGGLENKDTGRHGTGMIPWVGNPEAERVSNGTVHPH